MTLRLGKLPAREDAVQLKLSSYIPQTELPAPPPTFGWDYLVPSWPMYGNDQYGDCVWAGAGHESQMLNAAARRTVTFTDDDLLAAYTAVTGFDRTDPSTDQGTDVQLAASYRRKTGLVDTAGNTHRVAAYIALEPGNLGQLYAATWIFGAVGIGIEMPAFAMDQFNAGKPWRVARTNTKIEGGHYIPAVARVDEGIKIVTWGREVAMSEKFYQKYCDEAIVYLSTEMLTNGVSLGGFNLSQLQDDLGQVAHVQ